MKRGRPSKTQERVEPSPKPEREHVLAPKENGFEGMLHVKRFTPIEILDQSMIGGAVHSFVLIEIRFQHENLDVNKDIHGVALESALTFARYREMAIPIFEHGAVQTCEVDGVTVKAVVARMTMMAKRHINFLQDITSLFQSIPHVLTVSVLKVWDVCLRE